MAEYAGLLVAPVTLRMERDVSTKPRDTFEATMQNARLREYQTLAGVLLLVGFGAVACARGGARPSAALCLGAFVIAYVPISNVFSLNATVAEHWLYVPSAFLFLAAALTLRSRPASAGELRRASAPLRSIVTRRVRRWACCSGCARFSGRRTGAISGRSSSGRSPRAATRARMLMNLGNVESGAGKHDQAPSRFTAKRCAARPSSRSSGSASPMCCLRTRDLAGARGRRWHARRRSPLLARRLPAVSRGARSSSNTGADSGDLLRAGRRSSRRATGRIRKRYLEHLIERGDTRAARARTARLPRRASVPRGIVAAARRTCWKRSGSASCARAMPTSEAAPRDVRDEESRGRSAAACKRATADESDRGKPFDTAGGVSALRTLTLMISKPHSALILVGHGSTVNPDSSAPTFDHAEEIARRGVFGEVHCAFWKEEPSLRQVLHMVDARRHLRGAEFHQRRLLHPHGDPARTGARRPGDASATGARSSIASRSAATRA